MRCHVEFHCSWKVPLAKDGENKIFDGTKHRILLSFLLVTHTLSHKHWFTQKLVRRFIFRLKKYHLFFLTFMRYQIVPLSILLKYLKLKKKLAREDCLHLIYKMLTKLIFVSHYSSFILFILYKKVVIIKKIQWMTITAIFK